VAEGVVDWPQGARGLGEDVDQVVAAVDVCFLRVGDGVGVDGEPGLEAVDVVGLDGLPGADGGVAGDVVV